MNRSLHNSKRLPVKAALGAAALAAGAAAMMPAPAMAAPAGCEGDSSGKSWVWLEAQGMRNSNGWLTVKIYNNSEEFLGKGGSMDVIRVPAQAGDQRICMKLPDNGTYGFFVYHDEDKNKKLNFTLLPPSVTEGGGFSNNPKFRTLRRPSWSEAALNISKPGLATRVKINYP